TYLRVDVHDPNHDHLLDYVYREGSFIYRMPEDLGRMLATLKVKIASEGMALRYAQWLLEMTQGGGLWLLASVNDVPFLPTAGDETGLKEQIRKAKESLAPKITPPVAARHDDSFMVTQLAVKDRDLVRYQVEVSPTGRYGIKRQTVEAGLPVVYEL